MEKSGRGENGNRKPLRTPSGHPESDTTLGVEIQEVQSNRMNWENKRTKCGPEVSGLGNKDGWWGLHLERIQVWGNLI